MRAHQSKNASAEPPAPAADIASAMKAPSRNHEKPV
jgi:hypothetical protein